MFDLNLMYTDSAYLPSFLPYNSGYNYMFKTTVQYASLSMVPVQFKDGIWLL